MIQVIQFFDWLVRYAEIFHKVVLHYCIPYHGENQLDCVHSHVAKKLYYSRNLLLTLESFKDLIDDDERSCEVCNIFPTIFMLLLSHARALLESSNTRS